VITPKLSAAQQRVWNLMKDGAQAEQMVGYSVHINGKRVCNLDTLVALERVGLIEREEIWTWKAKEQKEQS
jgi:hypothetical protein